MKSGVGLAAKVVSALSHALIPDAEPRCRMGASADRGSRRRQSFVQVRQVGSACHHIDDVDAPCTDRQPLCC